MRANLGLDLSNPKKGTGYFFGERLTCLAFKSLYCKDLIYQILALAGKIRTVLVEIVLKEKVACPHLCVPIYAFMFLSPSRLR